MPHSVIDSLTLGDVPLHAFKWLWIIMYGNSPLSFLQVGSGRIQAEKTFNEVSTMKHELTAWGLY